LFAKGGKRCREILCVGVCLFYILNEEVQRKEIVEIRKIIDSNDRTERLCIDKFQNRLVAPLSEETLSAIVGQALANPS
jgi:hypothetical protein